MLLRPFFFLCTALLLCGCFETKDEFTINPDGSGKVVHETYFQAMKLFHDDESSSSAAKLKGEVSDILEKSEGVDAWEEITYKLADDGRMHFRGTAYFSDINKLKLHQHSMLKFSLKKDLSENLVIEARSEQNSASKTATPKNLTDEELAQEMKEQRAKFQQARPMFLATIGNMKHQVTINLPGPLKSHTNFQAKANQISLAFDGTKLVSALDKLIADDELMKRQLRSGKSITEDGAADEEVINQTVFGSRGPIRAVIGKPHQQVFDYAKESTAAKTKFAAIRKELGLITTRVAPAMGGQIKSAKVVGMRLVSESQSNDLRPFHENEGMTLVLKFEFPGSIVQVNGKLEKAITDTGIDLVSKKSREYTSHFPKLSKDKSAALLDFKMQAPNQEAKSFSEITGTVEYVTAAGTKLVDLGFAELKEKTEGKELQSIIQRIEPGWKNDGSQQLSLQMRATPDQLVSLKLVDAAGREFALERRGYSSTGSSGTYSFTFEHKSRIPEDGKLLAETFDQLETYTVPFTIEKIDLLGRPL